MKRSLLKTFAFSLMALLISGCGEVASDMRTVNFDNNTSYKTNNVLSQSVKVGGKVKKPSCIILDDNPDKLQVYAWYKDKGLTTQWNFKKDIVNNNLTLYAEWKKTFTVNYFVGDNDIPTNTVTVFDGDTVKEHPDYCIGFDYLGSYLDKDFTIPFNYEDGVTCDTNIYMKKSDGISLYEGNPAGGLYDNLEIYSPSDIPSTPLVPEVGTISRTTEKDAVFIDFGYSPDIGDPFIELSLNLDISKSQVLHFEMKHFGKGTSLYLYFTALLDIENFNYSATTKNYNENFVALYNFKPNEIGMTEEDDYIDVAVDLAKLTYNGYSVWGTSPFLGKVRIQPTYISQSPTDRSNTMLLKRIYGSNEGYENGVVVEDSAAIKEMLNDEQYEIKPANPKGFVFSQDEDYIVNSETTETYSRNDGLLMHFENEIAMRKKDSKTQIVTIDLPIDNNGDVIGDKQISLDDNKALYLTLRNFGYATSLTVVIENDYGGKTFTTLKLDPKSLKDRTYSLNLSREALMMHTLKAIHFEYQAVGVDNVILLKEIYLDETKPLDINGISFDDKAMFGLTKNSGDVEMTYEPNYYSVGFDVKESNSEVISSKNNINITNMGYYGIDLAYTRNKNSLVNDAYISFLINNSWTNEYHFEFTETNGVSHVDLNKDDMGIIKNIKIRFEGTGIIRFSSLRFTMDDLYCFDMSHDISRGVYSDWTRGMSYTYDDSNESSCFTPDLTQSTRSVSLYLAIGNQWYGDGVYNCKNLCLEGKTKIVVVYHNSSSSGSLGIMPNYCGSIDNNPDDEIIYERTTFTLSLQTEMKDYEWNYAIVNIPVSYQKAYIGKITLSGLNDSLNIRMISVI